MRITKKTLKLILLTSISGIAMGFVSKAFLESLAFVSILRESNNYLLYFLPIVGMLTAFIYKNYGNGAQRGNNLIIDSIHREAHVPLRMSIFTFLFTILTHLSGGSAGREGTAVQIGGTITNKLAQWFKLDLHDKRILVMSGISAGFGSVFGTPLAGTFFGMEMCFVGKLSYEGLFPCFIASYIANFVTEALGTSHVVHTILSVPQMNLYNLFVVVIASCMFGIAGKYFSILIHTLKRFYAKVFENYILRAFLASIIILIIMFAFNFTKYAGLSTWMIDAGFEGKVNIIDPFIKFLLTCLTLGAGFQGGEVTPLFDIGASLGGIIGQFTNIEPSFLAGLGLISVFGCAANTPITTIMLGIEMFGTTATPFYIIAALISYYITGHNGIYNSQIIYTPKFRYLDNHSKKSIEEIKTKNVKINVENNENDDIDNNDNEQDSN